MGKEFDLKLGMEFGSGQKYCREHPISTPLKNFGGVPSPRGWGAFRSQLPLHDELLLVQLYCFIVGFKPVNIVITLEMFSDSWLRPPSSLGETVCQRMSCRRF